MRYGIGIAALLLGPVVGMAQTPAGAQPVFQKVCGACHTTETVTSQRRTRAQWQESINSMVARGAKGTEEEFALILDYLTLQLWPGVARRPRRCATAPAQGGRGRGAAFSPGPADKQVIDTAAADRGRRVYAAECIDCHGTHARGGDKGADLVRSEVVLHDRYGSTIGPFLRKGHPTQTTPAAKLTDAQILDLSHTIHQEVYNTLRAALQIQNVVTGMPRPALPTSMARENARRATRLRATWLTSPPAWTRRRFSSASCFLAGAAAGVDGAARRERNLSPSP